MIFSEPLPSQEPLRKLLSSTYRMDETTCVDALLQNIRLSNEELKKIEDTARDFVVEVRKQRVGRGGLDAFLYRYDLSSEEGIALMCLAEALLRIPDTKTIDSLIKDKITSADWQANIGKTDSFFVNAATWGLMLTGKVLNQEEENPRHLRNVLKKILSKTSGPIIREAVGYMMKVMGKQFIVGNTINEALDRSTKKEKNGYRFSYDMLGEAARTMADADRYYKAYQRAIDAIGEHAQGRGYISGPGISVKLSALHPRYELAKRDLIFDFMVERLKNLALQAKNYGIGLTVDAEEADRLDLSLDILEAVFSDPSLEDWEGLGLAVQAYQKRAFPLIDWLANLARKYQRRWMIRLVKGAYWDYEIKDSQVKGLENYPVFTRKTNTDVSYLACAQKIIAAKDAFYPMFATHNAQTVAAILYMMGDDRDFEFQCLQGMGRALYDQIVDKDRWNIPCRIYAPVGTHEDLLPYLVRRLLENGANTSFVNRIVDDKLPIKEIIADPILKTRELDNKPHPRIPLPRNLYGSERLNSYSYDLSNIAVLHDLDSQLEKWRKHQWHAKPLIAHQDIQDTAEVVYEPSDQRSTVGNVIKAKKQHVEAALVNATTSVKPWDKTPVEQRAKILEAAANLLEKNMPELMALAIREGGKTILDAQAEVREAIDFCRYYAVQARHHLQQQTLPGPTGESNMLQLHGRGVFVCISPWNFPLAIFTGQITAALVTGNAVIAKPSEQTPLIAARAVQLFHEAGIPKEILQLLPGPGSVIGAALIADPRVQGVLFTGSTETARIINQTLANRPGPIVPFIAETGGQNAMIADSSALPEQLVMDVMTSAFYSAGQRCSALRVLFLQEDIADKVIHMLKGAMQELVVGSPHLFRTDIGPIIDSDAKKMLEEHAQHMQEQAKLIYQVDLPESTKDGTFFAPVAFEITDLKQLKREVFGPVLHVLRYNKDNLDGVINAINETGYGLTLGIHSRIDHIIQHIQSNVKAGNCYVNRNMIGAIVGVQPFGGEGLSGTGPKAGGPHYLTRLCTERTFTINTAASGGNTTLLSLSE